MDLRHRYLRKVDCSKYFSWQNICFKERAIVVGTKQSRQRDKAGGLTRQTIQVSKSACFNVAATSSINKTKQGSQYMPLISLFLKQDVYGLILDVDFDSHFPRPSIIDSSQLHSPLQIYGNHSYLTRLSHYVLEARPFRKIDIENGIT
jgi:hypothetical protein